MSLALQRNNSGGGNRVEVPAFVHREMDYMFRRSREAEDPRGSLSSSSTSSIGKNSDEHPSGGNGSDEEEVQSEYKGGPVDSKVSLEDVLPVQKSISKFYFGKSKSYTSLPDAASCPSVKDITKSENVYTRKCKNLLVFNNLWNKNQKSILRNQNGGKRATNSRSMLSLSANTNCSESNSGETSNSNSSPPGCCLPPLPPNTRRNINSELSSSPPADKFPSWRSFSLSDLQGAAEAATPMATGLWSNNTEKYSHIKCAFISDVAL